MIAASLNDTGGVLALVAIAFAGLSGVGCLLLARSLRRMRAQQRLVLGDGAGRDVIAHAASLQQAFEALRDDVGETMASVERRLAAIEDRLDGAIAHRALVRYDAYNELSGRQSMSLALLDRRRNGVVLTCIHHRDQARVYAKQVLDGHGELELSPEEDEAVASALAAGSQPRVEDDGSERRASAAGAGSRAV